TADIIGLLKPIWNEMPETASRVRGRIEKIIAAWKVESGQQDKFNPATWKGHLAAVFPPVRRVRNVRHHPALHYDEVPALMAALSVRPQRPSLPLRFLILTACRTGEVLGARWSEIDFARKRWSIPATRMKAAKAHVVPLSDAAVALLDEAARHR